ncbi:alpha/beta-hydrolase [Annulohypoxylon bovei var. microspora]|nr:alpha/beta-hydrolase [Annulohypoxylon bovei var. microspora]
MVYEFKLDFYPAPRPNRTGVLVLPGGGYEFISLENEGVEPAHWLNARGIDAWVFSYPVTNNSDHVPLMSEPYLRTGEAIGRVLDSGRVDKLGVWGFSAGGHLAAMIAITTPEVKFAILAYPVISMAEGITHNGSRRNLLGDAVGRGGRDESSVCAEKRVNESTPPTFLFHTANDDVVSVQNSLSYAAAMAKHKRPFEMLILPDGPHGAGLALGDEKLGWTGELERWLKGSVLNS